MRTKDTYIEETVKITFDLFGDNKITKMIRLPLLSIKETLVFRQEYEHFGGSFVMKKILDTYDYAKQANNETLSGVYNAEYMGRIKFNDPYHFLAEKCGNRYLDILEYGCNCESNTFIEVIDSLSEKWNISPVKIQDELSFRDLHDYATGVGIKLGGIDRIVKNKEEEGVVKKLLSKLKNNTKPQIDIQHGNHKQKAPKLVHNLRKTLGYIFVLSAIGSIISGMLFIGVIYGIVSYYSFPLESRIKLGN